jgi:hypothetical protein
MRLALAALVIIAAAGPLWNPPLATTKTRAPLAILIDDGWAAAATWDARLRTADDIIARAEDDRRAVALIPLSEGRATFHWKPRVRRACACTRSSRSPYTIDRGEALPALSRFLARRAMSNWSGCPTASISAAAPISSKGLAQTLGQQHPITIVAGGIQARAR